MHLTTDRYPQNQRQLSGVYEHLQVVTRLMKHLEDVLFQPFGTDANPVA